jgi:hypothetical protein
MIADIDPVEMGTVTIEFDKLFSSAIESKEVKLFFDPRLNAVYLAFKYQSINYRQYWDKSSRDAFAAAYKQYQDDYDVKALLTKDSKSRAIYGGFDGMTQWSTFAASFSEKSTGYPKMRIGYTFKRDADAKNKPYFSIMQLESKDESENKNTGDSSAKTSLRIRAYYTRAQAEALIAYFDNGYLMGLVREYAKPSGNTVYDSDNYDEETETAPLIPADDYNN